MSSIMDKKLAQFRRKIDSLDRKWIKILSKRFKVIKAVGEYKKAKKLVSQDPSRESRMLTRIAELAKSEGLDQDLAQQILKLILTESVKSHKKIKNS